MIDLKSEFERLLDLTGQQARVSALIGLSRGRVETELKRQFAEQGTVAKFKRAHGEVRLDGADPTPKAVVTDPAEWASWVAQDNPDVVTATITVPVGQLEDALTALDLAGVNDVTSTVTVDRVAQESFLKTAIVLDNPDWSEGSLVPRWLVASPESGDIVPGLGGRLSAQVLKVILPRAVRERIEDAAVLEDENDHATADAAKIEVAR